MSPPANRPRLPSFTAQGDAAIAWPVHSDDDTLIILTPEAFDEFTDAIENPAPPTEALVALFTRSRLEPTLPGE